MEGVDDSVGDVEGMFEVERFIDSVMLGAADSEGVDDMIRLGEVEYDGPTLGEKDGEPNGTADGLDSGKEEVGINDGSELGLTGLDGAIVPINEGEIDSDGANEAVSVGSNDELGFEEESNDGWGLISNDGLEDGILDIFEEGFSEDCADG